MPFGLCYLWNNGLIPFLWLLFILHVGTRGDGIFLINCVFQCKKKNQWLGVHASMHFISFDLVRKSIFRNVFKYHPLLTIMSFII